MTGEYPSETEIKDQIVRIKDLIAYRIVISLPKCHVNRMRTGRCGTSDIFTR